MLLSSFSQTPDAKGYYEKGVKDLESKNYIEAIASFTNALSEQPNFGAAYLQRAKAKHELAVMAGYESIELCMDLSQAFSYGEKEAIPLIQKYCQNQCYKIEMAFYDPELVFCADFSSKILYEMPKNSYLKFNNLTKLNLFNNKFTEVPVNFVKLNLLIFLDLSSNRLTEVQPIIGKLIHLEELKLNKNQITKLSPEIGKLQSLKQLHLKGNRLARVPDEIANLKKLEYLDLSANYLKSMPDDLSKFTEMKTLLLMGNNFSKKEQQRIVKALPNSTIYF